MMHCGGTMNSSIQIGRIMNIPIKLHITFLLIIPVFAWIFANNPKVYGFDDVEPISLRYTLSFAAALLLFICVLLHELGHSYIAKKYGTKIQGITLFLFGGVSSMEEIPRNPRVEFRMALAGPLVSLFIGVVLIIIYTFFKNDPSIEYYNRLVFLIGTLNIILFAFNLLPAFPMDGGRVFRAVLAERMPYIKATKTAANVGKMFAILMGIFGVVAVFSPILILIAFFIYIGASEEEKATEINVTLEGVKIKDIMSKNIVSVKPDMTVEELVELMFRLKHMGYPVMDDTKIEGIVTFTDVQKVSKDVRKNVKVSQIMTKDIISLEEQDDVVNALKVMTLNNIGRIIIKNRDQLVGILSRTDILRSIQLLE
jgi:Zn-dependent protease/predicted transcriptional regulator